jgi:hypothetical protein
MTFPAKIEGESAVHPTVAALFVEPDGVYANLPGVDLWPKSRDARLYTGPWPVVAHPECQRWGRYSEVHPIKGKYAETGADSGCFAAALTAVRIWGGVIEHPKDSKAFGPSPGFSLGRPAKIGWTRSDDGIGWICRVDQGHYGHIARKSTFLYAAHVDLPELIWGPCDQQLPQWMIDRYGYEKARRIGVVAMIGGKDKTKKRNATPERFRDLLISIARTAKTLKAAA